MNVGTINGLTPSVWHTYRSHCRFTTTQQDPQMDTDSSALSGVQLFASLAKYMLLPNGDVQVQIQQDLPAFFTSGFVLGGGSALFSLPVPAYREIPNAASYIPLGKGMAYANLNGTGTPNPNIDLIPTLAPPSLTSGVVDDPDYWFVGWCEYALDFGSFSLNRNGTVKTWTVNHTLGFAFDVSDITWTFTNHQFGTTPNPPSMWVDTITASSFNFNVRAAPATGTAQTGNYKIRTHTPASGLNSNVVGVNVSGSNSNSGVPYAWQNNSAAHIYFSLKYRPRR